MHAKLRVRHSRMVLAHAAGTARVVGALPLLPDEVQDLLVGLHLLARGQLVASQGLHGRAIEDAPGTTDGLHPLAPVLLGGEVVKQDGRVLLRVGGLDPHVPSRVGEGGAHMHLVAVAVVGRLAVVADGDGQEVELHVGLLHLIIGPDEAARLELVAGADAGAAEEPLGADPGLAPPGRGRVEAHRLLAGVLDIHLQVILQAFAHSGHVVGHLHAQGREPARGPAAHDDEIPCLLFVGRHGPTLGPNIRSDYPRVWPSAKRCSGLTRPGCANPFAPRTIC